MANWCILIVFLSVLLPTVESRKCYECRSTHSWEKCVYNQTETTCPPSKPACMYLQIKDKKTQNNTFIKGCWEQDCDMAPLRCKRGGAACAFSCCEYDWCNLATPAVVIGSVEVHTSEPEYVTSYDTINIWRDLLSPSAAFHHLVNVPLFLACTMAVAST